jgi:hypothetical protein
MSRATLEVAIERDLAGGNVLSQTHEAAILITA